MLRSSVGLVELEEIFLTHYHADHFLGLPGCSGLFAAASCRSSSTARPACPISSKTCAASSGSSRIRSSSSPCGPAILAGEYRLEVFAPNHGRNAVGYALVEEPRPGRFDADAAEALAIPIGPERGALQRGEPVTLPDGRVITPDSVVGEPRPGRKVVYAGDTAPAESVVEAARRADVLVHEATFAEEERGRAEETLHSTAAQAAEVARDAR